MADSERMTPERLAEARLLARAPAGTPLWYVLKVFRKTVDELDAVTKERQRLIDALAACVVKAIERGEQDGGYVLNYVLPTGPIHAAIPLLQEFSVTVRPGFDGRQSLTPEQQQSVNDYVHEMETEVIPEIVRRQQWRYSRPNEREEKEK